MTNVNELYGDFKTYKIRKNKTQRTTKTIWTCYYIEAQAVSADETQNGHRGTKRALIIGKKQIMALSKKNN